MSPPLTAMVSYQSVDAPAAELLHEELALRGLLVFHDRCTFPSGSRIASNMDNAVATCDGFVAYLTPNSLYESRPPGSARPAIDAEFKPIMDRLARSNASPNQSRRPVIIPLTHGLGDPRGEAPERVRKATGKDISTLWAPVTLDQRTRSITQTEAASVGKGLIAGLLESGAVSDSEVIDVAVTTRGEGQPPAFLSVDATNSLGGATNRPGDPADWDRYLTGLRDLQGILAHWTQCRKLNLRIRAHLTAAIAFGRVFNQAGGWRPTIQGRQGDVYPSDSTEHGQLRTALDKGGPAADFSVEIDLLDVKVSDLASDILRQLPNPATNRLCVWREESGSELTPNDVAAMAAITSMSIRDAAFDIRPSRIHLFCASPVEFAVLVGHRLTSLHADIHLYERDGDRYASSLVIPGNS